MFNLQNRETMFMIVPIFIYLCIIGAICYAVYLLIDQWVSKSNEIKKEQNALLKEIIKLLEKKQ